MKKLVCVLSLLLLMCGSTLAFDISRDSGLMVLVNKSHSISADFKPEQTALSGKVPVNSSIFLREEAAQAYIKLYNGMKADGITECYAVSGYRSYNTQQYLVSSRVAGRVASGMSKSDAYARTVMTTAPAGGSEHQTGLAIDCSAKGGTSPSFSNSPAGKWMKLHAWEYGFVLRYEGSKTAITGIYDEPWHFRYLGVPHAQIMYEHGWCYEEYVEYLQKNGIITLYSGNTVHEIFWTKDTTKVFAGITDISRDNAGGWIITTNKPLDPFAKVYGHWSAPAFMALKARGASFTQLIIPEAFITRGEFAALCGMPNVKNPEATLTREEAACLAASTFQSEELAYLQFADLAQISGFAFQSVQRAVAQGVFMQGETAAFEPKNKLIWAEAVTIADRLNTLEKQGSGEDIT